MIEQIGIFVLALIFGTLAGTFTGIMPGIHINLVASGLLALPFILNWSPFFVTIFIVSMAIAHTFNDFIPSVFFGAPDEDTVLAVLPGHKFLLEGLGLYAVKLTLIGSMMAVASLVLVVPGLFFFLELAHPFIERMMAFFLIWAVILLLLSAGKKWKISLLLFLISGALGFFVLNSEIKEPLLPLLTGLFGSSSLIYSIGSKSKIPKQETKMPPIFKEDLIRPFFTTAIISPICSVFPGLGSSQAAIIGSKMSKKLNREQFLILLGSINTLVMAVSFVTLFLIGRARSGAAVAISEIVNIDLRLLGIILISIVLSSAISFIVASRISREIAFRIDKINYSKISFGILILLCILILLISGFFGFFIFIISTAIGILCINLDVGRSFLMGCLLTPTIIYYLPF